MPDPAKLKSFLDRTQKAMQDAVDRGDQAGVDQYEGFLDRANQVGERLLGAQGPKGPEGPSGLAGVVPQEQPVAPTLQPPVSKIEADIEGESMPPPGANKPSQAKDYEAFALRQKQLDSLPLLSALENETDSKPFGEQRFPVAQPAPSSNPVLDFIYNPNKLASAVGGAAQAATDAAIPQSLRSMMGIGSKPLSYQLQDLGDQLMPAPKAVAPKPVAPKVAPPALEPEVALKPHEATELPGDERSTYDPNLKPTQEPVKSEYGEEPKFFSLHRLAQILLTGAPSAVNSFDKEKAAYEGRKFHTNERIAGEKRQLADQTWHTKVQEMKGKVEANKAMVALLPHQAREEARPYLQAADNASKRLGDMMRMIPPPPPEDPRWAQLNNEVEKNMAMVEDVNTRVFAPVRGQK